MLLHELLEQSNLISRRFGRAALWEHELLLVGIVRVWGGEDIVWCGDMTPFFFFSQHQSCARDMKSVMVSKRVRGEKEIGRSSFSV